MQFVTTKEDFKRPLPGKAAITLPDNFVDKVNIAHQDIRQKLGGIDKTITLSPYDFTKEMVDFACFKPNWYYKYNHWFRKNKLTLGDAAIDREAFWSKFRAETGASNSYISSYIKSVGSASSNSFTGISVKITTNPTDFANLGHSYVDNYSCFCESAYNASHKYILAQNPGSFVGYILQREKRARFTGFIFSDCVVVTNFYPYSLENIVIAITALSKGLGKKFKSSSSAVFINGVYQNSDSLFLMYDDCEYDRDHLVIQIDDSDLEDQRMCYKCQKLTRNTKMVDQVSYCPVCLNHHFPDGAKNKCEISGKYTNYGMKTVYDSDSFPIKVSSNTTEILYQRCEISGKYYRVSQMKPYFCSGLANIKNIKDVYKVCKNCDCIIPKDDEICTVCKTETNG